MKTLIAVAHADDETLGCYSILSAERADVTILHATDSAPRNLKFAWRAGFPTRNSYAAARRQELQEALQLAGIPLTNYHALDIADQEAPMKTSQIRDWVADFGADRVFTHAYEGGHPDHDAVARALYGLPNVWEFPLYHAFGADFVPGEFLEGDTETIITLNASQQQEKRQMLACFRSQQRVIDNFPIEREHFRPAPVYDFSQPPHAGPLYYEKRGLGWTWLEWREAVQK